MDKEWHMWLHHQLYVCLSEGLLSDKKLAKLLTSQTELREHADSTSLVEKTAFTELSAEESKMRASCRNLLVLSTMFLADGDSQTKLRRVRYVRSPRLWHGQSGLEGR